MATQSLNRQRAAARPVPFNPLLAGAAAGALATLPMSVIQVGAYYAGLSGVVAPDQVTRSLLEAAHMEPDSELVEKALVAASHLGYGAAGGAGYAALRNGLRLKGSPVLHGALYGLSVWAVSYIGWVPAAGILPPPEEARRAGVAANILAHALYGGTMGWLLDRLNPPAPIRPR